MYFCLSNSLQQTPGRSPYWCLSSFYFYLSIIENSLWLPSRIISVIKYFDNPGKMLTKGPRDLKRKENLFGRSKTEESGKLTHLRRLRPKTAACWGLVISWTEGQHGAHHFLCAAGLSGNSLHEYAGSCHIRTLRAPGQAGHWAFLRGFADSGSGRHPWTSWEVRCPC